MARSWRSVGATNYQGNATAVQSALHIAANMRSAGYVCFK